MGGRQDGSDVTQLLDSGDPGPWPVDDVLEDLPAAFATVDPAGRCTLNRFARDELSLPVAGDPSFVDLFAAADRAAVEDLLAAARAGERATGTFQLVVAAEPDPDPASAPQPWTGIGGTAPLPRFLQVTGRAHPSEGPVVAALVDVTEPVRAKQLLSTIVIATMIVDDQARPVWGPVGHAPESGEGELTGTLGDRTHPEDLATAVNLFVTALENPGSRQTITSRVRHPSKEGIWHEARVEVVNAIDDPRLGGLVITTLDSTDGDDVPSLGQTTGTHLSVADAAPVGIILTGPGGLPMYFNKASRELLPAAGVEAERDWTRFARPADRMRLGELIAASAGGQPGSTLAHFDPGDGGPLWLLVTTCPRVAEGGRLLGQVITLQDVTAEVAAKEELELAQVRLLHLARHDPLTGLVNRGVLADELTTRLAAADADGAVVVLFCDLDGFKSVNDRFGHATGDDVLAEAADRLRGTARAVDPRAVVARAGGDEFVVVLGGGGQGADDEDERGAADGLARAEALVERLRTRLADPFSTVGDATVGIGMSIGIATSVSGDDADSIVHRADAAMYDAKAAT